MSRAGCICIYRHVACMFHVICMDLGCFPCMLHACYMKSYLHATCIQHFNIKNYFQSVQTHRYRGGVGMYFDIKRFRIPMTYLAYTLSNMRQTRNMHVTCLLFTCYSHYMHSECYHNFNTHTTCILPLLQHACCLNMHHTWLLNSCYRHVKVNMPVRANNIHVGCTRFSDWLNQEPMNCLRAGRRV